MIEVKDKKNCCGCSACASVCPRHCITMGEDSEGFLYPQVDEEACVNCGLCEKVCNELQPYDTREPLQVLAAINKDDEIRQKSSSGGIFHLLAEKTIGEGGVVFGARFDENWQVLIDYAEDMKDVEAFMGSKYVQARMGKAYANAKRFLCEGRKVLFSGTPCQVAGLHKFLRKPYDNLLTVDVVCYGVPSPKVWGIYLDEVIREGQHIGSVRFRNQGKMWRKLGFYPRREKDSQMVSLLSPLSKNHFMKAFLGNIILRPSCYECKVKDCSSQSDITIADFWGIETLFLQMDDNKGTGMVFVNTEKGKSALDFAQMRVAETTYDSIRPLNPACWRSAQPHPKREDFFRRLGERSVIDQINDCTKPTLRQRLGAIKRCTQAFVVSLAKPNPTSGEIPEKPNKPFPKELPIITSAHKIASISFRSKDDGWRNYNMVIRIK